MKIRWLPLSLSLLIVLLAYGVIWGKNGFIDYRSSSAELLRQELLAAQYAEEEALLRQRLDELSDPIKKAYTYQTLARYRLNYIGDGETFYRFVKKREQILPQEE